MHPRQGCIQRVSQTCSTTAAAAPVILVLARVKLREDVDEFANAAGCQRPAGIQHRLIIGQPGLGLGEFVHGCAGSNDLGDGDVVGSADRPGNVLTRNLHDDLHHSVKSRLPSRAGGGIVPTSTGDRGSSSLGPRERVYFLVTL